MNHLRCALAPEAYKLTLARYDNFRSPDYDSLPQQLLLLTARGRQASFQLLLEYDEDYALDLGMAGWMPQRTARPVLRPAVSGPFSATMSLCDMHAEADIQYADALLTSPVHELPKYTPRAVFISLQIPEDTLPGQYTCRVSFFLHKAIAPEVKLEKELTVSVQVYPYTMPKPKDWRFYLDLWQHNSNIARQHEVALWSDAHFEILEKYLRTLADLGQKAATVVVSEVPWSGQGCHNMESPAANLFEYSIIPVTRDAGGYRYDYTFMQRYIDLCRKVGIDSEISLYGLCNVWGDAGGPFGGPAPDFPDAVKIRYYDQASGSYQFMDTAADIDDYIRSLYRYFIDTDQLEKVRLAADEPGDIEAYRRAITHLKEIAPNFQLKAALNHAEFVGEFGEEVSDYAPFIAALCSEYDKLIAYKKAMPDKRFLWYICCYPAYPNTFLSSPLTEAYILGLMTSYAGFDGLLRWAYTCWTDNPRSHNGAEANFPSFAAGDAHFVYPGKGGQPLLSLRYHALRKGIELYEMCEALRAAGKQEALDGVFTEIFKEKDIRRFCGEVQPQGRQLYRGEIWCESYEPYVKAEKLLLEALSE